MPRDSWPPVSSLFCLESLPSHSSLVCFIFHSRDPLKTLSFSYRLRVPGLGSRKVRWGAIENLGLLLLGFLGRALSYCPVCWYCRPLHSLPDGRCTVSFLYLQILPEFNHTLTENIKKVELYLYWTRANFSATVPQTVQYDNDLCSLYSVSRCKCKRLCRSSMWLHCHFLWGTWASLDLRTCGHPRTGLL